MLSNRYPLSSLRSFGATGCLVIVGHSYYCLERYVLFYIVCSRRVLEIGDALVQVDSDDLKCTLCVRGDGLPAQ